MLETIKENQPLFKQEADFLIKAQEISQVYFMKIRNAIAYFHKIKDK